MGVNITIDGRNYPLPGDTDVEELRRRVAQAIFRCEVEQLHLADGRTMLVNWRSVRTVFIGGIPPSAGGPPWIAPARTPRPNQSNIQPNRKHA